MDVVPLFLFLPPFALISENPKSIVKDLNPDIRTSAFFLQSLPEPTLIPTEKLACRAEGERELQRASAIIQNRKSPNSSGSSKVTSVVLEFIPLQIFCETAATLQMDRATE